MYRRGKMCWGTDECENQPFQLDICAFESHTETLFAQADDKYIEQHFHTALSTRSGITLASFLVSLAVSLVLEILARLYTNIS